MTTVPASNALFPVNKVLLRCAVDYDMYKAEALFLAVLLIN